MMETIELHQAWTWDCTECGRENVTHGITVELTPEESREMAAQMGVPEEARQFMGGNLMSAPTEVECKFCHSKYAVEPPLGGEG
jgi:hypothetical protein